MSTPQPAGDQAISTRKALAFVYAGYAFRFLYLLILVPFYGRVLGAAEYGRVLAAMALYQFVWAIVEYGFPSVGLRDIALDPHCLESRARIYGEHVAGRLWTTAAGILVGIAGTVVSPVLLERPIFGVCATLSGLVAAYNLGWYFQGTLRFRTSVLVEFLGFTANIIFVLVLVHKKSDGWLVLGSLFISSMFATVVAHLIAARTMNRQRVRLQNGRALVRESSALFAARGLTLISASSSTFLMSIIADARQVGWYGASDRLVSVGLNLMVPANQVMIGTVATLVASEGTEASAFRLIRKALVALMGFGCLMLLGAGLLAGIAVPIVLGPDFGPSVRMLRILGLSFPFAAFSQVIIGYVLVPLRHDRLVTLVSLAGAVSTIALTLLLGRSYLGDGVAWARTLGYVTMCIMLLHFLRRYRLVKPIVRGTTRAEACSPPATSSAPVVAEERHPG